MFETRVEISHVMESSGVKFGTSGARGLVSDMTDEVCYAYTLAFLQQLQGTGQIAPNTEVALAGDLRPSTARIMGAVAAAIHDSGYTAVNCGRIPSPAVAYHGLLHRIPSIMVTGSHIPDDRNGIKFNKPDGEILKEDEEQIAAAAVQIPGGRFNEQGNLRDTFPLPPENTTARTEYVERYRRFFGANVLAGQRIGIYQHSSVARDLLTEILEELGAETAQLARSETFIPVDTEAIRPEDKRLASRWAESGGFNALVSTDGDGDRPLISDERGNWLRGDVAGVICARFLHATTIATPISSNTALEKSGWFAHVSRTRIGSPYVIAAMNAALAAGHQGVVGYEANGGFLTASSFWRNNEELPPLPTRDAMIVIVAVLALAGSTGRKVSELLADLPQRYTSSDRVKEFPVALAREKLDVFVRKDGETGHPAIEAEFGAEFGPVEKTDTTDGLRITFCSGDIVHLRPSGNAPELRCYTESDSPEKAEATLTWCMEKLSSWKEAD